MSFENEVSRPVFAEVLGLFREPEGCPGGDARIVPDIEDVGDTLHRSAACAGDRDIIDVRPVGIGHLLTGELLKLFVSADDMIFITDWADPDRDRDTPVSLPGDTPVACLFDPVVESCRACPVGEPGDFIGDLFEHLFSDVFYFEEPLGSCPVDDRRLASPAVPVPVGDLPDCKHGVSQDVDDLLIGFWILDVFACKDAGFFGEVSVSVDRADGCEIFLQTDEVVIPAVTRSDMDHSGVFHRHVIGNDDTVFDFFLKRNGGSEGGNIFRSGKFGSGLRFDDRVVLIFSVFEDLLGEVFCDPEIFAFSVFNCPAFCVDELFSNGHCHVCRKGPGCGCPDDEVFVLGSLDWEFDEDRGVGLVPVLDFGIGDRRSAAGTPVDDSGSAFEHFFFFAAFEGVPCSFDVSFIDGLVRVVEVHPGPEVLELLAHQIFVGESELSALFDELGNAVFFDVGLVFEPELLLDFDLDRETVHVVTGTFDDMLAGH